MSAATTSPPKLLRDRHVAHLTALAAADAALDIDNTITLPESGSINSTETPSVAQSSATKSFAFWATEHLRISGVYWALAAADVLGRDELSFLLDRGNSESNERGKQASLDSSLDANAADAKHGLQAAALIKACQDPESGGFAGNKGHDPHLLYTLSAVQVALLADVLDAVDVDGVVRFVSSLQRTDGSFTGDKWGEVDTRFSYCALSCLALLGRLNSDCINLDKAVDFIAQCRNFDGGFGTVPGAETHAGQVFCCVGALAIAGRLDVIDFDQLGWWLCERQTPGGGLNGRPEKLPDVCYSWWVVSALSIIDRLHWIDSAALQSFILESQDPDEGGIADRPGDVADVYHTFFGLAGLSLTGYEGLRPVDPAFALAPDILERHGIRWKRATEYSSP